MVDRVVFVRWIADILECILFTAWYLGSISSVAGPSFLQRGFAQYREFYRHALCPAGLQDIRIGKSVMMKVNSLLEKPLSTACFLYVYEYI